MTCKRSIVVLALCLPLVMLPSASAQTQWPSGADVVKTARAGATPLGYGALATYNRIRRNSFSQNVDLSNNWIRSHIKYYDSARNKEYREYVKDMIDGGGDVQLGMRGWLSDPKNVAWWDNAVRAAVKDDGYARLVALNAAFPAGSNDYRWVYGGTRRFDAGSNDMSLNGTSRKGLSRDQILLPFNPSAGKDEQFAAAVRLGDAVRRQMFNFYEAYANKKVTPEQVKTFNEAFIWAGGCAMSNTDSPEPLRTARYINALNFMAAELGKLGFKVQTDVAFNSGRATH